MPVLAHPMLGKGGMRYVAILAVVAIVYFVLVRRSPVAEVKEAVAQTEVQPLTQGPKPAAAPAAGQTAAAPAPASSGIRRPIDRTHAVLNQVKGRNGGGDF